MGAIMAGCVWPVPYECVDGVLPRPLQALPVDFSSMVGVQVLGSMAGLVCFMVVFLLGGSRSGAQHLCSSRVSFSHVRWFDASEPGERAGALFGMSTGWWLVLAFPDVLPSFKTASWQCLAVLPLAGVIGAD